MSSPFYSGRKKDGKQRKEVRQTFYQAACRQIIKCFTKLFLEGLPLLVVSVKKCLVPASSSFFTPSICIGEFINLEQPSQVQIGLLNLLCNFTCAGFLGDQKKLKEVQCINEEPNIVQLISGRQSFSVSVDTSHFYFYVQFLVCSIQITMDAFIFFDRYCQHIVAPYIE